MNEYSYISTNAQSLVSTSLLKKKRTPEENEISGFEVSALPLPDVLLREIFKYISAPKDRCYVRETSKQFKNCLDSSYWGRCFSGYALSDSALSGRFRVFFESNSYSDGVKNSLSKAGVHLIPKEYAQMSVLTGVSSLFKLELSDDFFSAVRDAQKSSWTLKECCYALELLGKHGHGCDSSVKAAESICLVLKSRDKSNWTDEECCHLLELISKYCMTFKWEAATAVKDAIKLVFGDNFQTFVQHLPENIKVYNALLGLCAVTKNKKFTEELVIKFMMAVAVKKKAEECDKVVPDETTGICLLTVFASCKDINGADCLVFGDKNMAELPQHLGDKTGQ